MAYVARVGAHRFPDNILGLLGLRRGRHRTSGRAAREEATYAVLGSTAPVQQDRPLPERRQASRQEPAWSTQADIPPRTPAMQPPDLLPRAGSHRRVSPVRCCAQRDIRAAEAPGEKESAV